MKKVISKTFHNPNALDEFIEIVKKAEVDSDKTLPYIEKPPIVTICGSGNMEANINAAAEILTANLIMVLKPDIRKEKSGVCRFSNTLIDKQQLYRLHFSKIMIADFILVIAIGGYIGEAVQGEIEFAEKTGKNIYYLYDSIAC